MGEARDTPIDIRTVDSSDRDDIYRVPSTAGRSLSDLISPDDWRLYHLMRELPNDDRHRILSFAEMLFALREAKSWAESQAQLSISAD